MNYYLHFWGLLQFYWKYSLCGGFVFSLLVCFSTQLWLEFIPKCLNKLDFGAAIFRWGGGKHKHPPHTWEHNDKQCSYLQTSRAKQYFTMLGQTKPPHAVHMWINHDRLPYKQQEYNLKVPAGLKYAAFRLEISTSVLLSYLYATHAVEL